MSNAPDWTREAPETYAKWARLITVLNLIQEELPRLDQRSKLAALVDAAFALGREAEREASRGKVTFEDLARLS